MSPTDAPPGHETGDTIAFPPGFRWGTATAAHQVEGGNVNSDWWDWEHRADTVCVEPSGDACDHYHRYPDDIATLADLGLDHYRFSVEWARIEPEEGEWSRAALDHYRRMAVTCRAHGVAPVVTFHHFTSPRWVQARGGWDEPTTADRFARFCERTVAALGDLIEIACTINEPNGVAMAAYRLGVFPPGASDPDRRRRANGVFIEAHRKATEALGAGPGDFPIGLTLSMHDYQAVDGGEAERDRILEQWDRVYLDAVAGDDFVGVQTYTRQVVGPEGHRPPPEDAELTANNYEIYPAALANCVRRAWDETDHTPVLVTENGISTDDDALRVRYLSDALAGLAGCIEDGVNTRGYFCWSAMDNFEWIRGYEPTFGLIAVDRTTFERTIKPSARWLGEVARANALDRSGASVSGEEASR